VSERSFEKKRNRKDSEKKKQQKLSVGNPTKKYDLKQKHGNISVNNPWNRNPNGKWRAAASL